MTGDGGGDGGKGERSPLRLSTHCSAAVGLMTPAPKSAAEPPGEKGESTAVALVIRQFVYSARVRPGRRDTSRARAPVTMGQAIDVPDLKP